MASSLTVVFAGTPEFAATALRALLDSPHRVAAVYCQPDRAAGRGRKVRPGPVSALARERGLPLHQPASLVGDAAAEALSAARGDVMVVAAYGLLLPPSVLEAPRLGCVNIHASILPRWRGAAPVQRAIIAGDRETGISIMQMDEGLDTGPVLAVRRTAIDAADTGGSLERRLAALGAEALLATLADLARGPVVPSPQDDARSTYAARVRKSEARLEWTLPAAHLERRVRAFDPWPVAFTDDGDRRIRVWESAVAQSASAAPPGTVLGAGPSGIDVATGDGALRLARLQLPGRQPVSAREFLNGYRLVPGTVLGTGGL